MTGYKIVELKELVTIVGESRVNELLSSFCCPMSPDVECFLRSSAVVFAKQGIAATHLVFTSFKDEMVLVGYFAIANKFFTISDKAKISKTQKKRLCKFGSYEPALKRTAIAAPLIAQLGKNFANNYNKLITGAELLELACQKISIVHAIAGGRYAYVECEYKPKLIQFYEDNGFKVFAYRELDANEKKDFPGGQLVQLIRHFDSTTDLRFENL